MRTLFTLIACLCPILHASTRDTGGKRTEDVAREIFLSAAATHLKIPEKDLDIHPASTNPGEPDLKIGDFRGWHVWKKNGPRVLTGFSSAGADPAIAFNGYKGGIGEPGGIAALLKACHIHDRKKRPSAGQIARRVAFCLNHPTTGEILFDKPLYESSGFTPPDSVVPPALIPQKTGQILTYITMTPGNTGTWSLSKFSVTILPDFKTLVTREDLR